jgi:4-hydroxy-4-methyl-2-oxoglutarate aldolase
MRSDDLAVELAEFDVATLYEASKGAAAALDPGIRPAWPGATVCGRALTVQGHPGDNLWLHHAVSSASPGEVIVADVGGHLAGYWGEVLAVAAMSRGVVGLVIDGGLRDVTELEALAFGSFSRGVSIGATGKFHDGQVNVPVVIGGALVRPGDYIVADADGAAVLPPGAVASTLASARARRENEHASFARLRAGETTHEIFGLRSRNG